MMHTDDPDLREWLPAAVVGALIIMVAMLA